MNRIELEAVLRGVQSDLSRSQTNEGFMASGPEGPFFCPFGRDGAITSILLLEGYRIHPNGLTPEFFPAIRKTLETLAFYQAKEFDPWRDTEPGKILHEPRYGPENQPHLKELKSGGWPVEGEEGNLFMRYGGSIDATSLWLVAVSKYIQGVEDWGFFHQYKTSIIEAYKWMILYGDMDGDGFLEFSAKNRNALLNQGWQDSGDSILTEEKVRPKEPIALVEVQGYAYWAYKEGEWLFRASGDHTFADELAQRAEKLKKRFNENFWMGDKGYFAHALDGDKKQIRDIRSNPGHLLITGIVDEDKVDPLVKRLMAPDLKTEFGVRTLNTDSPHFTLEKPGSYHRGSVWPHDNAMIALGFIKYGYVRESIEIAEGVLEATKPEQLGSVELYEVDLEGKTIPYTQAAKPQGWSAAGSLLLASLYTRYKLAA